MNNRMLLGSASLVCSATWVAILIALLFVEEYFFPSKANSSWQRGFVLTPFVIVPALVVIYFVCKKPWPLATLHFARLCLNLVFMG